MNNKSINNATCVVHNKAISCFSTGLNEFEVSLCVRPGFSTPYVMVYFVFDGMM